MVLLRALPRTPVLRALPPAVAVCFAIGALTHAGVTLPLGVTTIDEPTIVPAAIVEAIIAVAFGVATYAELAARPHARLALAVALRVGIAGVLLGMFALALGRGTRTELNDVFHVVALIAMLLLGRLSSRSADARSCWSPRPRLPRRAT
jgi:hypothetical protein